MSDVAIFKVLSARKSAMERLLHGLRAGQRGASGAQRDIGQSLDDSNWLRPHRTAHVAPRNAQWSQCRKIFTRGARTKNIDSDQSVP